MHESNNGQAWQARRRQLTALIAGSALSLSACTTQLTTLRDNADNNIPSKGFPYHIPAKVYSIDLSWRLSSCDDIKMGAPFEVDAAYASNIVAGETFLLDYEQMSGPFKTSALALTFHKKKVPAEKDADDKDEPIFESTGLLKTVNATIEGQEAAAIKSALGVAVNVAKIVVGGVPPAGGAKEAKGIGCSEVARLADKSITEQKGKLKNIETALADNAKDIARIKLRALADKLTKGDEAELDRLQGVLDVNEKAKKAADDIVADETAKITFSQKCNLIPSGYKIVAKCVAEKTSATKWLATLFDIDASVASKAWLEKMAGGMTAFEWFEPVSETNFQPNKADASDICSAAVIASAELDKNPKPKTAVGQDSYAGLIYRDPVQARFCIRLPTGEVATGSEGKLVLVDAIESVPQLGKLRRLPLHSGFGERNGLVLEFAQDGGLLSASHSKPKAAGAEIATSLEDASKQGLGLAEFVSKRNDAEEAARKAKEKTPLQSLQDEIALIEAQQKLEKARKGDSAELSSLTAELALRKQELELLTVNDAISKLKAGK